MLIDELELWVVLKIIGYVVESYVSVRYHWSMGAVGSPVFECIRATAVAAGESKIEEFFVSVEPL